MIGSHDLQKEKKQSIYSTIEAISDTSTLEDDKKPRLSTTPIFNTTLYLCVPHLC